MFQLHSVMLFFIGLALSPSGLMQSLSSESQSSKGGLWEEGAQNTLIALMWELGIDCVFKEQFVCGK